MSNISDLPKTKALCSSEQEIDPPVWTIKGHFCRSKLSQTSLIVIHFILFLPRVLLAGENALHEIDTCIHYTMMQLNNGKKIFTWVAKIMQAYCLSVWLSDQRSLNSVPVHHSAAAFTVTSPGGPNPFTPFKYSGIWLNFTGVWRLSIHETYEITAEYETDSFERIQSSPS